MHDDPGWPKWWNQLRLLLIPTRSSLASVSDGLVLLRGLFLRFCYAIALIGVVRVILGDLSKGDSKPGLALVVVVAAGVGCLVVQSFVGAPLDCTSDDKLASSYRSRFFLRVAFSEAPAMIGFAVSISFGPLWIYFVGASFAAVGFIRVAPSKAHLAADQRKLSLARCGRRLVPALRAMTAAPTTRT
jgi:F0F1-type ATP synthase membrane subunit c/vacuolar-type H+-ATPase subunit K